MLVDAGGPHMDKHKMWRLVLFTWLGAGGVHGQPWQELCAIPAIMMYLCHSWVTRVTFLKATLNPKP